MFNRLFTILTISILFVISLPSISNAKTFDYQEIYDPMKSWTITFSDKIDYKSQNDLPIYILTDSGEKHPITIIVSDDFMKVTVKPAENYSIGKLYTLFISKEMKSKSGKNLKEDATKQFELKGTYLLDVQVNLNPFMTNVKVQATREVSSIIVSINGQERKEMNSIGNNQFERGLLGLAKGDVLLFEAYGKNSIFLESRTYVIK